MPTININVKVKAGKRTPSEVAAYYTAVNEPTLTLVNGREVSASQIAEWIAENLQAALHHTESDISKTLAENETK
jgi:hypothetical protein